MEGDFFTQKDLKEIIQLSPHAVNYYFFQQITFNFF